MPKSTITLASTVAAYVKVADVRGAILTQCKITYDYLSSVPAEELSDERKKLSLDIMRALATTYGFPTSGAEFDALTKIPANRPGGIGVSTTALKQRFNAYAHVVAAGITPDILNVTAAFRLHSITAEGHDKIVARVTDAVKAGGDFKTLADSESDALTAARKAQRESRAAKSAGGAKGPVVTPENVLAGLKWASANRDKFSPDEVTMLNDMLAQVTAIFADDDSESVDSE